MTSNYNKNEIDRAAEAEGIALDKLHKNAKDKRLQNETSSYGNEVLKKLFDNTDLMLDKQTALYYNKEKTVVAKDRPTTNGE